MHQAAGPPDRIRLSGIRATGHHGVLEHERRDGQTFVADVVLHLDTRPAAATDRLDRTVHYGVLAEEVAAVLSGDPADLVETVAERIAAQVLTHPLVEAVDVVVHKPQAPIAVPFTDVTVEVHRSRGRAPAVPATTGGGADVLDLAPTSPVPVVLALGSNLGPSREVLRQAVRDLSAVDGLDVTAVSPLARTEPVGGPDQPPYLNAVVLARTTLAPRALLRACQAVEAAHGRERHERWGPRTLDVDVVVHGPTVARSADLELPHPRAHERAFVLAPWARVDPGAVLPGPSGGAVRALAEAAPDRAGLGWAEPDGWPAGADA